MGSLKYTVAYEGRKGLGLKNTKHFSRNSLWRCKKDCVYRSVLDFGEPEKDLNVSYSQCFIL